MSQDRITQLRISGLRCITNLSLDLRGLTVLIGDNGSGKSTIIEALELLRQAAKPVSFVNDILQQRHGGLLSMLRDPGRPLHLGVTIEGAGPLLTYDFEVVQLAHAPAVAMERLDVYVEGGAKTPLHAVIRDGSRATVYDIGATNPTHSAEMRAEPIVPGDHNLTLPQLGIQAQAAVKRVVDALDRIDSQLPFETRPRWQLTELGTRVRPRDAIQVEGVRVMRRYGENVANCFHTLRNIGNSTWERVLARVRLGLGDDFRDFQFPTPSRGSIELALLFGKAPDRPVPLDQLSEGQLAYLCFVALVEFSEDRAVLAIDEPELHLHPALLPRVLFMLEPLARHVPVILSTHSDPLLDALEDPAASVVLCELDEQGATRLRRPDAAALAEWLTDYRGLGDLRANGYEPYVFRDPSALGGGDRA